MGTSMHPVYPLTGSSAGRFLSAQLYCRQWDKRTHRRLNSDGTLEHLFDPGTGAYTMPVRASGHPIGTVCAGRRLVYVRQRLSPQPYRPSEPQWLGG